jgi:hypothetical protein
VEKSWECLKHETRYTRDQNDSFTPTRHSNDMVHFSGVDPQYDKPVHQQKVIQRKGICIHGICHSPQDNALQRELRIQSKKVLLDKAQSLLDSTRKEHVNQQVRDIVLKHNGFRNASESEKEIQFPSTISILCDGHGWTG